MASYSPSLGSAPKRLRTNDFLSINDLAEVRGAIWDAAIKWKDIGIELKMKKSKLNSIEERNNKDPERCTTEMLTDWLNCSDPRPTWSSLIHALCQPPVGHGLLAISIQSAHPHIYSTSYGLDLGATAKTSSGNSSASSTQKALPKQVFQFEQLDVKNMTQAEKESLEIRLREETNEMINKLSNLIIKTKESLKEQGKSPVEVASCIISLGAFNNQSMTRPLLEEEGDTLSSAQTVDKIFCRLPYYMSFLDYGILKHIISNLGTDTDHMNLQAYEAALKEFCKRKVFEVPQEVFEPLVKSVNKSFLAMKYTGLDKPTLNDVIAAKGKIASILGLNTETLHLVDISQGCIELHFLLPTFVYEQIIPIKPAEYFELSASGIQVSDDLVQAKVKKVPSLGRPFHLGMLYDTRTDTLLDTKLYTSTDLEQITETKSYERDCCEIILEDSIDIKCHHLGIDADLKLSLMTGMVRDSEVTGSAKFFYDRPTSLQVVRVGVMYKHTTKIEQLNLVKLREVQYCKDSHPSATHVVVGVVYGWDALFIFDQSIDPSTRITETLSRMQEFLEDLADTETTMAQQADLCVDLKECQVKFFGDLLLPNELNSLHDAIEAFRSLPTLTEATKAVPKSILLCPLDKLLVLENPKNLMMLKSISPSLIIQVQKVFETLHHHALGVNDLMDTFHETIQKFKSLQKHLDEFKRLIGQCKRKMLKCISSLLPKIRGGTEEEDILEKVLHDFEGSPYIENKPSAWLKQKEEETKWLSSFYKNIANYFHSQSELDMIVGDVDCKYVVCLVVNADEKDEQLQNMQSFISERIKRQSFPPPIKGQNVLSRPSSITTSTSCHEKANVTPRNTIQTRNVNLRNVFRQFKSFAEANDDRANVKFVVVDTVNEISNEGTIVLYFEGRLKYRTWIPPDQPGKPWVTDIASHSVQVNWEKPSYGSESVMSYEVLYRSETADSPQDWKKGAESSEESALVTGLAAKEQYTFKIHAKCEVGIGRESEISEPIETVSFKQQANLEPFNSVTSEIGYGQDETVSSDFDEINQQGTKPQPTSTISSSEYEEENDSLKQSYSVLFTSALDKPKGHAISHCSIKLEWSKPEVCSEPVQCYTVLMRDLSSESSEKEVRSVNSCKATVNDLIVNREYVFKIKHGYKSGTGATSEESDPIRTLTTSQPMNLQASNILHNSIQLTWKKPEHGSENIKFYKVLYCLVDSNEKRQWKCEDTSGINECVTVKGLDIGKAYYFKVRPECECSVPCTTSEELGPIFTKEISPPGTPTPSLVTHNSIQLTWTKPEYGHDLIEHYTIQFKPALDQEPSNEWKTVEENSLQENFTISDLSPHTDYIFKVIPFYQSGVLTSGCESQVSTPITTNKIIQPGKPEVTQVSHDTVQLQWSKPEKADNCIIAYTVSYQAIDIPNKQWESTVETNEENIDIPGLSIGKSYQFKVIPIIKGSKPQHSTSCIESDTSNPITLLSTSQPDQPKGIAISHCSIKLEWRKPLKCFDPIESYTILMSEPPSVTSEKEVLSVKASDSEATITNLATNSMYIYKVLPKCQSGLSGAVSEASEPIITMATSKPKNLKASILHDSVKLKWEKPEHGIENIKFYSVLYRLAESEDEWKQKHTSGTEEYSAIEGLDTGKVYNVKVHPGCGKGALSPDSDIICTKTISPPNPISIAYDTIKLELSKPNMSSDTQICCYKVWYKQDKSENSWIEYKLTKVPDSLKANLTDLRPNTSYLVKVHAFCSDGEEVESCTITLNTKPFCKPGKPEASKEVTHNSLHLTWKAPEYGKDRVQYYIVQYCSLTDGKYKRYGNHYQTTNVQVTGLNFQSSYQFKVCPHCHGDVGTESDVSDPIETLATSKPGKPKEVSKTHNEVVIKWTVPSSCDKDNISSYTICHRVADSPGQWKFKEISAAEVKHPTYSFLTALEYFEEKVSGLSSETEYVFKVEVNCLKGRGAISDECRITTKLAIKPGKPEIVGKTHNSVSLKWEKPQNGSEQVKLYRVQIYTHDTTLIHSIPTSDLHISIHKLSPSNVYKFRVCAELYDPTNNHSQVIENLDSDFSEETMTFATSPPGKLKAIHETHNTIHLKWDTPHEGSENIISYTVYYSDGTSTHKSETPKESLQIENLEADTKYTITVQPNCKRGEGCASQPCYLSTKPLCQPGKPKCTCITHDSITIEWGKPTHNFEKVEYYIIFYREIVCGDGEDWKKYQSKDLVVCNSAEITGLTPGTSYEFKVYPVHTVQENSSATYSINSNKFTTRLTSKPKSLNPSNVTNSSVFLQWSEPLYGDEIIKHYTIICNKTGPDEHCHELKTNGKQEEYTVNELCHCTQYEFFIRPECDKGPGCDSDSCSVETLAVSKPGKPKIISFTHDTVELEWERPQHHSEDINSYYVYHSSEDGNWTKVDSPIKPNITKKQNYVVPNLACANKYRFKIKCECNSGKGNESDISDVVETKATSAPSKPSLMSDPKKSITHESIPIQWSKPELSSDIKRYVVFYRSLTDTEQEEWLTQSVSNIHELNVSVSGLLPGTKYVFKVCPVCQVGEGTESAISDPIETKVTSQPSKPQCIKKTHNSIQVKWDKPSYGMEKINSFSLQYCEVSETNAIELHWESTSINATEETTYAVTVEKLTADTFYKFKVLAECSSGEGAESEYSDPIRTKLSCRPGPPYKVAGTNVSIELEWKRPNHFIDSVISYTVHYYSSNEEPQRILQFKTEGRIEHAHITGLESETKYSFTVQPECKNSGDIGIEISEASSIKTDPKPLAEEMISDCICITNGPPARYEVPMNKIVRDPKKMIAKYNVGPGHVDDAVPEKVLMVVGATGAGKTTLINGIANYVFYTQWHNDFRFQLIQVSPDSESPKDQSRSQTTWITSYTFYPVKGSRIRYKLTVIDTPGFGDTEGIDRDKRLVQQINEFFSIGGDNGIDHINGIGFVIQAPLARLTPPQKYIFDQILAMYGNDIAENIFLMITFSDGQDPPVLAAVKAANIPFKESFKFNNSALFAKPAEGVRVSNFDKMFWDMGVDSFTTFFEEFNKAETRSLALTKEVLDKREHLEVLIRGLQGQFNVGLHKMEELRQEKEILEKHEAQLKENEHFTYEIIVTKQQKVDLQPGRHVTNCLTCNRTCHDDCRIADDGEKYKCVAMVSHDPDKAYCVACPNKCFWNQHKNNPYCFEFYQDTETRTSEDLKKRYDTAKDGKIKKESMVAKLKSDFEDLKKKVFETILQTHECLERLHKIALKPINLSEVEYIELLIETEKAEKKAGFMERIKHLHDLKEQAELLIRVKEKGGTFKHSPTESAATDETSKKELESGKDDQNDANSSWVEWFFGQKTKEV